MAVVVVVVVVVGDGVGLMGLVIIFERVGGGGVVSSFATILPRGIILKEQHVRTVKDHRCKSPPGVVVDKDEEEVICRLVVATFLFLASGT